jgi:hypothetical protein
MKKAANKVVPQKSNKQLRAAVSRSQALERAAEAAKAKARAAKSAYKVARKAFKLAKKAAKKAAKQAGRAQEDMKACFERVVLERKRAAALAKRAAKPAAATGAAAATPRAGKRPHASIGRRQVPAAGSGTPPAAQPVPEAPTSEAAPTAPSELPELS